MNVNMDIFQPALLIRYHESRDSVLIVTFSLNGLKQPGEPREMKHENLPTLLFQLIDKGYTIVPETVQLIPGQPWKEFQAFSQAFQGRARADAGQHVPGGLIHRYLPESSADAGK